MNDRDVEYLREDIKNLRSDLKELRGDLRKVQDFKLKITTTTVLISSIFGLLTLGFSFWLRMS